MKKNNFFVSCFGTILEIFGNKKTGFLILYFLYIIINNIFTYIHYKICYDKNKKLQKLQKLQKLKKQLKNNF